MQVTLFMRKTQNIGQIYFISFQANPLYLIHPGLSLQTPSSFPQETDWGSGQCSLHLCYMPKKRRKKKHYIASICQIFNHLKQIRPKRSGKKESVFASHLPPVGVLLVHYMQNVSFRESQPRLFTRDQVISVRIVVEMWFQIHLKEK